MGVLGKDLFDFRRPFTHVKVQFGENGYWIEDAPEVIPYGTTLLAVLELDARKYCEKRRWKRSGYSKPRLLTRPGLLSRNL